MVRSTASMPIASAAPISARAYQAIAGAMARLAAEATSSARFAAFDCAGEKGPSCANSALRVSSTRSAAPSQTAPKAGPAAALTQSAKMHIM